MRTREPKEMIVTEEVTGKSVNICHIIANPDRQVTEKLAIDPSPVAIVSFSPGEIAIAAADYLTKLGDVNVIFVDRYLGTVLITGQVDALKESCTGMLRLLNRTFGLEETRITMT